MRKYTPAQFRSLALRQAPECKEARVSAFFPAEIKAAEGDKRELQFTISTETVDRMGDTIKADGWELDAYRKNPVVLWGHDSDSLPVGKATRVWVEGGKLKATAEFTPEGMAKFNDTVFAMLKDGFLNAVSVGFMPKDYKFTEDSDRRFGIDFLKQELLEFSVVSVPANPEALLDEKAPPVVGERGAEIVVPTEAERVAKAARRRLARELELLSLTAS